MWTKQKSRCLGQPTILFVARTEILGSLFTISHRKSEFFRKKNEESDVPLLFASSESSPCKFVYFPRLPPAASLLGTVIRSGTEGRDSSRVVTRCLKIQNVY
ncbi:hypothetical protein RvY_01604 [Ramazzottius varieornatus]|uniref:Uncharacterized protein n=1 Tax=Ramazzottius varieornatus TaxID=947166 RepID=A0A1D1UKS3_RAMVA|nr:hypothetical protein RvY_01604 [Ramazzottius varieornatus]